MLWEADADKIDDTDIGGSEEEGANRKGGFVGLSVRDSAGAVVVVVDGGSDVATATDDGDDDKRDVDDKSKGGGVGVFFC